VFGQQDTGRGDRQQFRAVPGQRVEESENVEVTGRGVRKIDEGFPYRAEFRRIHPVPLVRLGRPEPGYARCLAHVGGSPDEPALARHGKWDGKVRFGVTLIPDNPGVTIAIGDPVEVLARR
jgi:hypothetical protein